MSKGMKTSCFLTRMLDKAVQDYITSIRAVGGVVNTAIVMAAAGRAQDLVSLMQHGGHIELEKLWAKSLLGRMGYVKRKCSNAGKVSLPQLRFRRTFLLISRLRFQ